jgi:regulator of protease activity HflC (stomatin/prohibitin superfamily)
MEQRVTQNATQNATEAVLAKLPQSNNRLDALSVYGTFGSDGSTSGGTQPGAGLSVNRVFSTGVASQHLAEGEGDARRAEAEGARDARRIEAMTQCMARAVASAVAGAGRDQLLAACAAAAGVPAN